MLVCTYCSYCLLPMNPVVLWVIDGCGGGKTKQQIQKNNHPYWTLKILSSFLRKHQVTNAWLAKVLLFFWGFKWIWLFFFLFFIVVVVILLKFRWSFFITQIRFNDDFKFSNDLLRGITSQGKLFIEILVKVNYFAVKHLHTMSDSEGFMLK